MEEQETKQNKHVFKIVLIIIGMLAFGALGFYFGSRCTFTAKEKKTKTETTVNNTVVVSEEETEEETSKTPKSKKTSKVSEEDQNKLEDFLNELPKASLAQISIYKNSEEAKTYKTLLYMTSDGIGSEYANDEGTIRGIVTEEEVNEYYQKYFTGSPKIQSYWYYTYEDGKFTIPGNLGGLLGYNIITYIDSYDKDDSYYYIYEYVGRINYEDNSVYSDYQDGNEITISVNYTIDETNKESFTKYVHKFVKLDDGSFLYDSTEKVS